MALRHGISSTFEWQYSPRSAVAVQGSWELHNKARDYGLFNGQLVANYAELKIDTIIGISLNKLQGTKTVYQGAGRPLAPIPEFIEISSFNLRLGHRFLFVKKRGKWQLSLQPALSIVRHQFFDNKQTFELLGMTGQSTIYGSFPSHWQEKKTYRLFKERQTMHARVKWLPGIAYDIGISRRFGQRWSLEARLSGLYNLETPYLVPKSGLTRSVNVRGNLFLGYSIGKIR